MISKKLSASSPFASLHRLPRAPRSSTRIFASSSNFAPLYKEYDDWINAFRSAPALEHIKISAEVQKALADLQKAGAIPKWGILTAPLTVAQAAEQANEGSLVRLERRNVFLGELKRVGIQTPESIGTLSVRNDMAFLTAVTAFSSILAVAAGQLPGQWGFWGTYLGGGITIAVLAIGSTSPGLLQAAIDRFSLLQPDYKERAIAHEAAHFLIAYLAGAAVAGYDVALGREQTALVDAKLQARLFERNLSDADLDILAVIAMAGVAAEGVKYPDVVGQAADLTLLQRLFLRSTKKLSDSQQQNLTRWAVYTACEVLKAYAKEYEAVQAVMRRGGSTVEILQAIEAAA